MVMKDEVIGGGEFEVVGICEGVWSDGEVGEGRLVLGVEDVRCGCGCGCGGVLIEGVDEVIDRGIDSEKIVKEVVM